MSSSSGGTNQGVDMSKVGNIAPRTTDFGVGPANFATYGEYGQPVQPTNQYNDLYGNLGVTGYNPPTSPLSTVSTASAPPATAPTTPPVTKANGGLAKPSQTHYTFGNAVDPLDFLAGGGQAMNLNVPMTEGIPLNSNVPMLQGRKDYRNGAYVEGAGDGQSDSIPAMLADGEYVMDADVVSSLGNGSNKAGAKVLDKMRENIRTHNRSTPINSIPSKAKSPLAYMKGAK